MQPFLRSLKLNNFLSFGPNSQDIELKELNVIIGPNASGKSNFIEALELIHATPTDISSAIRLGGTAGEWLWKGASPPKPALIEARIGPKGSTPELRYRLAFTEANGRLEIVDEALENSKPQLSGASDVFFYYRFQNGNPVINIKQTVKDDGAKKVYV